MTNNNQQQGTTKVPTEHNTDIWEKVYHTDARVTAMEGQLNDVSSSVARIEQHLLNKPPVNVTGWMGAAFALVTMMGLSVMYVMESVNLTLEPIQERVNERGEVVMEFQAFKHQTHYEFGTLHQWKTDASADQQHLHERMHYLQDQISELQKQAAIAQANNNNMQSELSRIDALGSRRWVRELDNP